MKSPCFPIHSADERVCFLLWFLYPMDILTVSWQWLSLLRLNSPWSFSTFSQITLSMHVCGHHHCWGGIKRTVAFLGLESVLVCCPSRFTIHYKTCGSAHCPPFQHSNCCLPPSSSPAAAALSGCRSPLFCLGVFCFWSPWLCLLLPAGGTAEQNKEARAEQRCGHGFILALFGSS